MNTTTSRRALLALIAAVPLAATAALPAITPASFTDRVRAYLEARAHFESVCDQTPWSDTTLGACDRADALFWDMMRTPAPDHRAVVMKLDAVLLEFEHSEMDNEVFTILRADVKRLGEVA